MAFYYEKPWQGVFSVTVTDLRIEHYKPALYKGWCLVLTALFAELSCYEGTQGQHELPPGRIEDLLQWKV